MATVTMGFPLTTKLEYLDEDWRLSHPDNSSEDDL